MAQKCPAFALTSLARALGGFPQRCSAGSSPPRRPCPVRMLLWNTQNILPGRSKVSLYSFILPPFQKTFCVVAEVLFHEGTAQEEGAGSLLCHPALCRPRCSQPLRNSVQRSVLLQDTFLVYVC